MSTKKIKVGRKKPGGFLAELEKIPEKLRAYSEDLQIQNKLRVAKREQQKERLVRLKEQILISVAEQDGVLMGDAMIGICDILTELIED